MSGRETHDVLCNLFIDAGQIGAAQSRAFGRRLQVGRLLEQSMSKYRDDRAALRIRLQQLEQQLAEVQDEDKRAQVREQLAKLAAQVSEATSRIERDRIALDELQEGIESLQQQVGGSDEPEPTDSANTGDETVKLPTTTGVPPRNKKLLVAVIAGIVALFAVCYIIAVGSKQRKPDQSFTRPKPTVDLPGFPHSVDPGALLPIARRESKVKENLISIKADYVNSAGLVDLKNDKFNGRIEFAFGYQPPQPPDDPSRPVGAPKPPGKSAHIGTVRVNQWGMHASDSPSYVSYRPVSDPRCSFKQVWDAARQAGAPANAVAIIKYSRNILSSEAVWEFEIRGTNHKYRVDDATCTIRKKFF